MHSLTQDEWRAAHIAKQVADLLEMARALNLHPNTFAHLREERDWKRFRERIEPLPDYILDEVAKKLQEDELQREIERLSALQAMERDIDKGRLAELLGGVAGTPASVTLVNGVTGEPVE